MKTLNPKSISVTDSATEIITASAARHEIIISNAMTGDTVFLSFETAIPIVNKGVPVYAGEKASFSGKHAQMKISGICDTSGTSTLMIQEI